MQLKIDFVTYWKEIFAAFLLSTSAITIYMYAFRRRQSIKGRNISTFKGRCQNIIHLVIYRTTFIWRSICTAYNKMHSLSWRPMKNGIVKLYIGYNIHLFSKTCQMCMQNGRFRVRPLVRKYPMHAVSCWVHCEYQFLRQCP